MIPIRSESELRIIRENSRILADIIAGLRDRIREGESEARLNETAERLIREAGAEPAFKGYRGYPASICTSVNEEIVHGIPGDRVLRRGDLLSVDVGIKRRGFYADGAFTVGIGEVDEEAERLITVTREALRRGIEAAEAGRRLSDISHAIGSWIETQGFSVVKEFVGHGIGRALHEDPQVPNFGAPNQGPRLRPGMVLAIEPMVKAGNGSIRIKEDGWTAVTTDGGRAAHFEDMVVITESGPEILLDR
ncbi:MAG: type I methionyl aminopeptidase [Candidatus Bipolaricaulia bacterium]